MEAAMYDCNVILRQRIESGVKAQCALMGGFPIVLI